MKLKKKNKLTIMITKISTKNNATKPIAGEIVDYAERENTDRIVIGTRGRTRLNIVYHSNVKILKNKEVNCIAYYAY
jgi:K+-sensing histidine kinase KdpD